MKKVMIFLCLISLIVGCSLSTKEEFSLAKNQIRVLSTTAMIGDVVKQVGGERIQHDVLITGEIDPHGYELVKGDDEKIEYADVLFHNGLYLEHGASLRYKIDAHSHTVAVGDFVFAEFPEEILFEKGQVDPHIWMDISLWAKIIPSVVTALSQADPEGASYYQSRAQDLEEKMLNAHNRLLERLQKIPESKRYLVTSHDAFGYFVRRYLSCEDERQTGQWRKRFAAPEGLAPDGQLGFTDLQEIIVHLMNYHIEVVFPESNISRDSLKKIVFACKEKQTPVRFSLDPLYGDCMGDVAAYLDMIEHNGAVLEREWR